MSLAPMWIMITCGCGWRNKSSCNRSIKLSILAPARPHHDTVSEYLVMVWSWGGGSPLPAHLTIESPMTQIRRPNAWEEKLREHHNNQHNKATADPKSCIFFFFLNHESTRPEQNPINKKTNPNAGCFGVRLPTTYT